MVAMLAALDPHAATSMPAPPGSGADREGARAMWTHELVAHLEATTSERPTVLIVDDVQWCDPLSLLALEVLCVAILRMPIALLVTLRDDGEAAPEILGRITSRARRLVVPPLTDPGAPSGNRRGHSRHLAGARERTLRDTAGRAAGAVAERTPGRERHWTEVLLTMTSTSTT